MSFSPLRQVDFQIARLSIRRGAPWRIVPPGRIACRGGRTISRLEADEGATQRRDDYVALKNKENFEQTRFKESAKVEKLVLSATQAFHHFLEASLLV